MATQEERRTATRAALLDAAARVLVEHGASGFTTAAVTEAAGLSNGALFRHFPRRAELLAATADHVLARLRSGYAARFDALAPGDRSPAALLAVLWEIMTDEGLAAVYELFAQGRTDPWLRDAMAPIHEAHGEHLQALAARVNDESLHLDPDAAARLCSLAVLAMQGLVLNNLSGTSLGGEHEMIALLADLFEAHDLETDLSDPAVLEPAP